MYLTKYSLLSRIYTRINIPYFCYQNQGKVPLEPVKNAENGYIIDFRLEPIKFCLRAR